MRWLVGAVGLMNLVGGLAWRDGQMLVLGLVVLALVLVGCRIAGRSR